MADYQMLYSYLFNKVTSVIEQLQEAQQDTEELYIKEEEVNTVLPSSEGGIAGKKDISD